MEKSLYCLTIENKFRWACIWLCTWKWFRFTLALIIILNSITLAFYDFDDRVNLSDRNNLVNSLQNVFNIIYLVEFAIKVVAFGFLIGKNGYLRSAWNILDFFIVICSFLELCTVGLTGFWLRGLRALRPLRLIHKIEEMRKHVKVLFISLPNL